MSRNPTKIDIEEYLKDEKNFRALEAFIQDRNKEVIGQRERDELALKRKSLRKQQYSRYRQLKAMAKV